MREKTGMVGDTGKPPSLKRQGKPRRAAESGCIDPAREIETLRQPSNTDRATRLQLAIHDHGTRDGATAKTVLAALTKEGFTTDEISKALKEWIG